MAWLAALVASRGGVAGSARADAPETRVFEIALSGGALAEANTTIRVTEGETVEIRWTSDAPVTLHLRGYDVEVVAKPGAAGIMAFEGFATGRFPIVAHGAGSSHAALLYLEVYPR